MRNEGVEFEGEGVEFEGEGVEFEGEGVEFEELGWDGAVSLTSCDFSTSFDVENDTLR